MREKTISQQVSRECSREMLAKGGAVQDRVGRRLTVLRDWQKNGIPDEHMGKTPLSLRQAARWSDASLGVYPIPSPNDFSTKHAVWGNAILEIQSLIEKLSFRYKKSNSGRTKKASEKNLRDATIHKQLEDAVSRWHSEREEAMRQRERAESAEARAMRISLELRSKEALIAELRKQLVALEAVRIIK